MVAIKNLAAKLAPLTLAMRQNNPCLFVMNAVGGDLSGFVTETLTGLNRIAGDLQQGNYYMEGHALYDHMGHRCTIDPSSQEFACYSAISGLLDFSLADDGNLMHQDSDNFVACAPAHPDVNGWSLFSDSLKNTTGCQTVTLRTGSFNCTALGRPDNLTSTTAIPASTSTTRVDTSSGVGSTSATSVPYFTTSATTTTTTETAPTVSPFLNSTATSTPSAACPTDLAGGNFQFPHLIVPTSPKDGDHAFGNSYEAYITPINTTIFNFDIPSTYTGTCALIFLFPYASDLDPSAGKFTFSGTEEELGEHGGIDFALLSGIATSATTFNNTPSVQTDYGKTQVIPGNNYTIATYPCQAGKTVSYSATSVGNVELDYFQDSAPSPIGLYSVPCTST